MIPKTKHATTNFNALKPFIDTVDNNGGWVHFTASGYMDLVMENLQYTDHEGNAIYSMAHYGEQNGDLMKDPDLEIAIDNKNGRIIPRSFQNDYMHLYQAVFKTIEGKLMYSHSLLKDLDTFLWQWLNNLDMQGFTPDSFKRGDF